MSAVLLLSGGLDSATLLAMTREEERGVKIHTLSVDYGQRHRRELDAARAIAKHYRSSHTEAHLTLPLESDLTADSGPVSNPVVPNRNLFLISVAAMLASSVGAKRVLFGIHAGDFSVFPDCRPTFLNTVDEALSAFRVSLETPFLDYAKSTVVRKAIRYSAPLDMTWTCYLGGLKHCGTCLSCMGRKEAFLNADAIDPVEYE